MVYVVLPPCVGCESVCDDVYDYIYVWYARCLHICLYDVYIYIYIYVMHCRDKVVYKVAVRLV